jgi:hypothetical protein
MKTSNLVTKQEEEITPDYVCDECWEKGEIYTEKIKMIRELAEFEENKLMADWKEKCNIQNKLDPIIKTELYCRFIFSSYIFEYQVH